MIAFDPSLTAAQYREMAMQDTSLLARFRPLLSPDFAFGLNQGNLEGLLDSTSWQRQPPRVRIVAAWNRRGNIRVNCYPHTGSEYRRDVASELFWFRGFNKMMYEARSENQAAQCLVYGHIARFNEIVAVLRDSLELMHAPRIAPFTEFNIDIFDRAPTGT